MQETTDNRYDAAGGVVADPAGERVLVLVRPYRAAPGGLPEVRLPKGHVEPGESHEEAARREVGEETGLVDAKVVADLGHQSVEFVSGGRRTIRSEYYFLMLAPSQTTPSGPEPQFVPVWLSWEDALDRLTFEAEREWLRRARLLLGL